MSALQLPLLGGYGVTGFDLALMRAIEKAADPATGEARSLFYLTERRAGLCYRHAIRRLAVLEAMKYVGVRRDGCGRPLAVWLC